MNWYEIIFFILLIVFGVPAIVAILIKLIGYIPINGRKLENMYKRYLDWLGEILKI